MVTAQTEKKIKFLFNVLPIVGGICVLVAMGLAIARSRFDPLSYSLMGAGFLLFLTLFLKAEVSNLKYYLHLTIYSVVVSGICVVGYLFATRYTHKWDLSEQKLYSLSDASTKYLKSLTQDVTITAFLPSADPFENVRKLYGSETDKIKWVFKDAIKQPLEARKFGEEVHNGEVFISSGENQKRMTVQEVLTADYENVLTNAIVDVTRKDRPKMYFVNGHGEVPYDQPKADPRQRDQEPTPSLQGFRGMMSDRGISSAQIDLAKEGKVPEDASMVILAGPKIDLYPPEARALEEYLDKGGKLLAMVDPNPKNTELPNLESTLEKYGVTIPNSIILDMFGAQFAGSPEHPLVSSFDPNHPITRDLSKRTSRSILGLSRPVVGKSQGPLQATDLVKSSPQSWAASLAELISSGGKVSPPAQTDLAAQPIGVAVSKGTPPSMQQMPAPPPEDKGGMRLVVFGTSELMRDDFLLRNQMGVEMMLNTINWLSQREDMIAVPSKQVKGTPIVLDGAKLRVIFVFSVVLIPALLFFGGVTYSVVRRRT